MMKCTNTPRQGLVPYLRQSRAFFVGELACIIGRKVSLPLLILFLRSGVGVMILRTPMLHGKDCLLWMACARTAFSGLTLVFLKRGVPAEDKIPDISDGIRRFPVALNEAAAIFPCVLISITVVFCVTTVPSKLSRHPKTALHAP